MNRPLAGVVASCIALSSALDAQSRLSLRVVDGDSLPLGLTSVIIRAASGDSVVVQRLLTTSAGTLQLTLPPGQVTVIGRRVGFRADSVRLSAESLRAESLRAPVTLRLVRIPPMLSTLLVRESQDCALSSSEADRADASLWDEVLKGIEARRLLKDAYRYERRYRRVVSRDPRFGGRSERVTDTVEVNDPSVRDTSSSVRSGAYTARRGTTINIRIFDESDLTRDSFLRLHCHGAPWRDTIDASVRISFSPRRGAKTADGAALVRGTVIMDGGSWLVRTVIYDYVRGDKTVGQGRVDYAPVTVDGTAVAMPQKMTGDLWISGRFGLGSQRASWIIDQTHSGFSRALGSAAGER
jgi:hypothetical protein